MEMMVVAMEMEMVASRVDEDGCGEDDDDWLCCALPHMQLLLLLHLASAPL